MSSTSSSSTSSSSRVANSSTESARGWDTKSKPIPKNQALSLTFFAYAAGGTLPTTIKKMTRHLPKDQRGTSDWFFFGMETRLFWVTGSGSRASRRRSRGRDRSSITPIPRPQPLSGFAPEGIPHHGGMMSGAPPPPPTGTVGGSGTASYAGYVNAHLRPPGRPPPNFAGGIPIPPLGS